ncbi:MAG: hypothetical protein HRT82_16855 [Henriciella sp.]|nr:hypothetical protein [Henriciella sp.]
MRYVITLIAIAATLFLIAWDTKELHPKDPDEKSKWQSIYICLHGEHFFCARNEHEQISNDALKRASPSNPWLIGGRTNFYTYDLNASYFRKDLAGLGRSEYISSEDENELERRLLPPVPHFAGLPDFSYTMYDWANKNQFCPALPDDHPDKANCHVFEGWHAARLNASHFGTQATKSYQRMHAIALSHAQRAADLRQAAKVDAATLKFHEDTIREAEYLALAYEAVGQHFLSDRWAIGHMFDRWGAPEYVDGVYDDPRGAKLAGVLTGILHGHESVSGLPDALSSPELDFGALVVPNWRFPAENSTSTSNAETFPGVGDYRYEDMNDGGFGAEYTYLSEVQIQAPETTGIVPTIGTPTIAARDFRLDVIAQREWMMSCLASGYGEIIRTFGTNESGGYGVDGMQLSASGLAPQSPKCFTPRATNAAIAQGWELSSALVDLGIGQGVVSTMARIVFLPYANALIEGAQEAKLGARLTPAERASLVRFTAKVRRRALEAPLGTDLAEGGFGRFGSISTGDKYLVASYFEPENSDDLPVRVPNGRDKEGLFGVFNRAGSDFVCDQSEDILFDIRESQAPADQHVCQLVAQRLYEGTWEEYSGVQSEFQSVNFAEDKTKVSPVCSLVRPQLSFGKSSDMPQRLHPGYVPWSAAIGTQGGQAPYSSADTKLSNQSIANWCNRTPVLDYSPDDGALQIDMVARFEEDEDEIVLSGRHFGETKGTVRLGGALQRAVPVSNVTSWSDTEIRFILGEQKSQMGFEKYEDASGEGYEETFVFIERHNDSDSLYNLRSVGRFALRKQVEKEEEQIVPDLAGLWESEDYYCDGREPRQELEITVAGTRITATKVIGDRCVNAGQRTWEGDYADGQISGVMYSGTTTSTQLYEDPVILTVQDIDTITTSQITFRRVKDELKAEDLVGTWQSAGYPPGSGCDRSVQEIIYDVTAEGEYLTAIQAIGDKCFLEGQIMWEGDFADMTITGTQYITTGPGEPIYTRSMQITVEDENAMQSVFAQGGMAFERVEE